LQYKNNKHASLLPRVELTRPPGNSDEPVNAHYSGIQGHYLH